MTARQSAFISLSQGKAFLRRVRRLIYDLRAYLPGLREQHRIEKMVGPVGFWKELERYQFRALQANGLQARHELLDIGCGPLQGGVSFIRYLEAGYYTGVDINPKHIEAARWQVERHRLASKNPRLIQSDQFGQDVFKDERFDFMWASQILYYFGDKKMREILAVARARLNSGGKFLGDFIDPDNFQSLCYTDCGFLHHTIEGLQKLADLEGMKARSLGRIEQYGYPRQLRLRGNMMVEFSPK